MQDPRSDHPIGEMITKMRQDGQVVRARAPLLVEIDLNYNVFIGTTLLPHVFRQSQAWNPESAIL